MKITFTMTVCALALSLRATTYRVVSTALEKTGDWAEAYTSLGTAVSAATGKGDLVLVKSGVYELSAQLMLQADEVTVRSDDGTGHIDAENTIIRGNGLARLLYTNGKKCPVVDGFTFTNGVAKAGAGLYVAAGAGAYKILNCTIAGCTAAGTDSSKGEDGWGAGLYTVDNSGGLVSNCVFRANRASKAKSERCGAAIYATGSDVTTVRDCTFIDNQASGVGPGGGAIAARGKMHIFDSTFCDNLCTTDNGTSRGGHVYAGNNSTISGCSFAGTAQANYGTCVETSLNAYVSNCVFSVRSSNHYGIIKAGGSTQLVGCRFTGCVTANSVVYTEATPIFRNCLIAGNEIRFAVHNQNAPKIVIEHCTVASNTYVNSGKALNFNANAKASTSNVVVNSIFEGTILENYNDGTSIRYVLTSNCYTGSEAGFVSRSHGDYRLKSSSPCVDAASPLSWTAAGVDLGGCPRTVGAAPDIGCYERQLDDPEAYVVRAVATDGDRVGVWKDAFVGIQSALDAALQGDEVWAREGSYAVDATVAVPCRELTLRAIGEAVLDGGNARRIMSVDNSTDGTYPKIVIDGFTFKNGDAGSGAEGCNGGGLFFRAGTSGATVPCGQVLNCVFTNCAAAFGGGLMLTYGGIASNCTFVGCSAAKRGGGACGDSVTVTTTDWQSEADASYRIPMFRDCTFSDNAAVDYGGGFGSKGLATLVDSCTFASNTANYGGNAWGGRASVVRRSFMRGGKANYGANYHSSRESSLIDCVLAGGVAKDSSYGSVSIGQDEGRAWIENCVVTNFSGSYALFVNGNVLMRNVLATDAPTTVYGTENARFENCTLTARFRIANIGATGGKVRVAAVNTIFASEIDSPGSSGTTEKGVEYGQYLYLTNCAYATISDASKFVDRELVDSRVCALPFDEGYLPRKSLADKGLQLDYMTTASLDLAGNPRVFSRRSGKSLAEDPTALPDLGCYERQDRCAGLCVIFR